jgi:hypothetical protein
VTPIAAIRSTPPAPVDRLARGRELRVPDGLGVVADVARRG